MTLGSLTGKPTAEDEERPDEGLTPGRAPRKVAEGSRKVFAEGGFILFHVTQYKTVTFLFGF